jgi:hypothetical protein
MVRVSGKIRRLLVDAGLVTESDWNIARDKGGNVLDRLLAAVDALRTDPHAAAEIDRLALLPGVLADVDAGLDVRALLVDGLSKGAGLAARERQARRGEPEAVR